MSTKSLETKTVRETITPVQDRFQTKIQINQTEKQPEKKTAQQLVYTCMLGIGEYCAIVM